MIESRVAGEDVYCEPPSAGDMEFHRVSGKYPVCQYAPGQTISALMDHLGPRNMDHMKAQGGMHLKLAQMQDLTKQVPAIRVPMVVTPLCGGVVSKDEELRVSKLPAMHPVLNGIH